MVFSYQPESELTKTPLYCSTHDIVSGIFLSPAECFGVNTVYLQ